MKPRTRPSLARKFASGLVGLTVLSIVVVVNRPMVAAASEAYHEFTINRQSYKEQYGHWANLPVPQDFKVNAIHAAMLNTGKLLIIAGSGNNRDAFEAGTFRTIIYDPATDEFKDVETPTDVFCAGHTFLPNGNLLIAGGTKDYEVLPEDIEHAYGVMKLKNESAANGPHTFAKGTKLVSKSGKVYKTRDDVVLGKATTMKHGEIVMTHAAEVEVFVDAVDKGDGPVVETPQQYTVEGLTGTNKQNIYGVSDKITHEKQEYAGDNTSYEFDPVTEKYVKVGDMVENRWYPTLAELPNGDVLAVSGLDEFGRIIPGDNEKYIASTKKWVDAPELQRTFPTYPSFHMMADGNLFYSGSNAGYGSDTVGRTPGIWNVRNNKFTEVDGLREPTLTETSSSVLLAPAQDQRVMIFGGGGVGESEVSTKRTDIIDLTEKTPSYQPGPDLPAPARYLNAVLLPDDTVFTTGGSSGYRGGKHGDQTRSDLFNSQIYQPGQNVFETAAESTVGRNYHSEAILLPDGRVVTMGSDPLYDESGKGPGTFEKRIEVYSPPYLFQGARPTISGGPEQVKRGTTVDFTSPDAGRISKARLVRPSAVTHVLDVDQRSVALDITPKGGETLGLTVPKTRGLVPSGWYMLFLMDDKGIPSVARWVQVA
ncbi:galactose oxidase-like domain-containing protein [Actinoplanes sp. NPDC051494]|uniref:galactose oxidase-like domain-containing protein n=1 Tax=Actinoplanes sp. NPDC051494 TaxID=3363907 RepID=UPI00379FC677